MFAQSHNKKFNADNKLFSLMRNANENIFTIGILRIFDDKYTSNMLQRNKKFCHKILTICFYQKNFFYLHILLIFIFLYEKGIIYLLCMFLLGYSNFIHP